MTPPEPLQRLLYASDAIAYPWPHTVFDIARVAERRNTVAGVNGCLFFSHTHYLQVLEGTETALARLWPAIARDRRHHVLWHRIWPIAAQHIHDLPIGYVDVVREPCSTPAAMTRPAPPSCDTAVAEVLALVAARFPSRCADPRMAG